MVQFTRLAIFVLIFQFCFSATAQLSGSYTIDSAQPTGGVNFHSFEDFATSINASGVSGNVIATVAPGSGPYNEQVVFNAIPGTSAFTTVTLDGSGETITALTTTSDRHVIRLSDVQYFNINNLHVAMDTSSTGGFYGIHLYHSGNHITISHCSVDIGGTSSTLFGAYVASGGLTSILDSGDFHDISFLGNTATGGGYGTSVFGKASNLASNIVISGNVFYDFHSNGVYLRETDGAVISNNQFDKRTANITSVNAIQIAQNANINANIFNNFIKVTQTNNGTVTFRGIYLFNGTGHKVYNNVMYDVNLTSGNFTGIEVRTGATAPEIYFNTISIDNAAGSSGNLYGIKEELSNTNALIRNNLISISQPTTGTKAGLVLGAIATVTSALNSNYNLIWVPNGNIALKNSTTPTYYATLTDWQSVSTQDANSVSLDPVFVSPLLPQPANSLADNLGTPIAWITTDVLGIARGVAPDIGAYEFPSASGILKASSSQNPVCYPNPFSTEFNVVLGNNEPSEIILYNEVSGKQLRKGFSGFISLNMEVLPSGIYFYELRSGSEQVFRGKVVKQ